jgi:hypothetical protein
MTKDEALRLALEALEIERRMYEATDPETGTPYNIIESIKACEEALAQPEPEPVVVPEGFSLVAVKGLDELVFWLDRCEYKGHLENCPDLVEPYENFEYREISTHPKQWVGLTNDEINNFAAGCHLGKSVQSAIFEAEAKLKDKNT